MDESLAIYVSAIATLAAMGSLMATIGIFKIQKGQNQAYEVAPHLFQFN